MKIGDLVRLRNAGLVGEDGNELVGVILSFSGCEPVVFWNHNFPNEVEYAEQLVVINGR